MCVVISNSFAQGPWENMLVLLSDRCKYVIPVSLRFTIIVDFSIKMEM